MPQYAVSLDLAGDADAVEAVLFAHGAIALTYTDLRDDAILEPAPGEFRLWPATRIEATFEAHESGTSADALRIAGLAADLGVAPSALSVRAIEDKPWEREWLRDFHAMRFGRRLWICPTHEKVTEQEAIVVSLDPGLAFGTGTHPTTAMCLEWLDGQFRGGTVIDYGCGSGILGIAAAKLGAARVDAFDIDPQALIATRDNAELNSVGNGLHTHVHARSLPQDCDVLLANILSGPLVELAPALASRVKPGGRLVLAGLLATQADEVIAAYAPAFRLHPAASRDDWVLLAGLRGP